MAKRSLSLSSNQPDPALLDDLARAQDLCLVVVAVIAIIVLYGWLVPAAGNHLPHGWALMKVNTALCALMSACSLACSQPRRSPRALVIARVLAILVVALSLSALLEYALGIPIRLDTLLAADPLSSRPGRMSPQTAGAFCLLGMVMAVLRARKRLLSRVADVLLFALCLLILTVLSGYVFGALRMFGPSMSNRTSPQTLIALMLLAFVTFARRSEYGSFSILLGIGMGGRVARIVTPFALVLPFLLGAGSIVLVHTGAMDLRYSTAIIVSIASMLTFALVVGLARLIENQEKEIRDLSLRDGLTELYNRRGFYILAEQALLLARRSGTPFSVFFIDLDNLKSINDSLGHETGSVFLRELADLLRHNFRASEIIGRIGGDEFVVGMAAESENFHIIMDRLDAAVDNLNAQPGRVYPLSFSLGCATTNKNQQEVLGDLLARADKSMYEAKKRKKITLAR